MATSTDYLSNALYGLAQIVDKMALTSEQRALMEGAAGVKGQLNAANPDFFRTVAPVAVQAQDAEDTAADLLLQAGLPTTGEAHAMMVGWIAAEGGLVNGTNNPLNVAAPMLATGNRDLSYWDGTLRILPGNADGVVMFDTLEHGTHACALNLKNGPQYAGIRAAFNAGDAVAFANDPGLDTWGTGRALVQKVLGVAENPINAQPDTNAQNAHTFPEDDQGNTYDCWLFAPKMWFEFHGHQVDWQAAYRAVEGVDYRDPGQPATFAQCKQAIVAMAEQVPVKLEFWGQDGYVRDFPNLDQLVRDGWCVVVGIDESVISGGAQLYHFEDLIGISGDNFVTADSYRREDGAPRLVPVTTMHQAIGRNWDPILAAIAFKLS